MADQTPIAIAELTRSAQDVLLHTLGLKPPWQEPPSRNHYVTDVADAPIADLIAAGLMVEVDSPSFLAKGDRTFRATDAGRSAAMVIRLARKPKLTRSQRRYRDYLDADSGLRFGDWLRTRVCRVAS